MVENKKSFSKNKQRRERADNAHKLSFVDKPQRKKPMADSGFDRKVTDKKTFDRKNITHKNNDFVRDKKINHDDDIQNIIKTKQNPHAFLYGTHAVNAALDNENRLLKVLYVTPNKQGAYEGYADRVKIRTISNEEMDNLLPHSAVHQGVALLSVLKEVSETADYTKTNKPVIVLDGLSDPQNIGAILRTCAAFGVEHIIMQSKGSPDITGAMAKAAAGAVESVRIHKVINLSRTLEELKDNNFIVYGADGGSENCLSTIKFASKSVIVMGAEGSGMRRLIKENCDFTVKIPIHSCVESLNVSNAFAVILYVATTVN
jgi:23S rRNA (guanosine2251-2'-O)-methyltransferase